MSPSFKTEFSYVVKDGKHLPSSWQRPVRKQQKYTTNYWRKWQLMKLQMEWHTDTDHNDEASCLWTTVRRTTVNNATAAVLVTGIQYNTQGWNSWWLHSGNRNSAVTLVTVLTRTSWCLADCKDTEGGILHIDAMGSVVVKNLSRSSAPIFLYSAVMSCYSVPTFDFLTNKHSAIDFYAGHWFLYDVTDNDYHNGVKRQLAVGELASMIATTCLWTLCSCVSVNYMLLIFTYF